MFRLSQSYQLRYGRFSQLISWRTSARHLAKLNRIFNMDQRKVTVIHEKDSESVDISFRFVSEERKIDRIFNLQRKKDEELSNVLSRISSNISRTANKKKRKKGASNDSGETTTIPVSMVEILENDKKEIALDTTCYNAFVNSATRTALVIGNDDYQLELNPPIVKVVELPKCMMAGYPLTVGKFKTLFADRRKCIFRWFKSEGKFETLKEAQGNLHSIKWLDLGIAYSVTPTNEDIGCMMKVVITPYLDDRNGEDVEVLSPALVSAGPGVCPFERRHEHTTVPAGEKSLRVISYNILADLYADGEFARKHLFPTCPSYAMDIDYRKQLLIKELLGYNGDLICMQEVDEKVFDYDLEPVLSNIGFEGAFDAKAGQVREGLAVFYRKEKLRLLERNRLVLSNELQSNILFSDMWEKLQSNEKLKERVIARSTVLQVSVLESVEDPSRIIVLGNTHLYFHPNADHIRILQGGICMQLLQQIICLYQTKSPEKDVSLLFCGDFNSTPEFGIYRFMTTQLIDTEDVDWSSCPEECIKDVEIYHNFEMDSACGLPAYTNYTVGFYGCLDYIFYQTDKFIVKKVIPMPTHEEVTEHTALPSITFPSDHIAIAADLEFLNRK
ncbi:2',5'-phosphodiesterase 12 [Palaemon carinicauda]|uniref:2',5'-phosphodiesterase 12 n=1 Tax=Palaemon carinicauda TaxID=392227 RepID=UPI0035B609D6